MAEDRQARLSDVTSVSPKKRLGALFCNADGHLYMNTALGNSRPILRIEPNALKEIADFELFRPVLDAARAPRDRLRGGRPPFDAILKVKMLYLQAQHGLSFEATEHLVRDRLSLRGLVAASPPEIGSMAC